MGQFLKGKHAGWVRLAILLTSFMGLTIVATTAFPNDLGVALFMIIGSFTACTVIGLMNMVLGQDVFDWIHEGFALSKRKRGEP